MIESIFLTVNQWMTGGASLAFLGVFFVGNYKRAVQPMSPGLNSVDYSICSRPGKGSRSTAGCLVCRAPLRWGFLSRLH